MSTAPTANLSFLPWVRQGAASAIATVDTLGPQQRGVADLAATLRINDDGPLPAMTVRLRGPADIVGIDAHQVLRTDPPQGSSDFEANCFPSIEFDRADFPWLFTPARAGTNARLRPWLCLIVVRQQEGVQITSTADAPVATLRIVAPAKPFLELPDLKEAWAWAHAQAAADDPGAAEVGRALNGSPALSLSRLICPRILAPGTSYLACVVPTFELGRKAGLGLPIADADLVAQNALAPAWTITATAPAQVALPVYYHWQFRTGPGGDFASLSQRLTGRVPDGLGLRPIDINHPGFTLPADFPADVRVAVEGALLPLTGSSAPIVWSDPAARPFEIALADVVNQPGLVPATDPAAEPLLAPPLYGRWHAGRGTATPGGAAWFDVVNLDPRWRVAAALGTRVVQEHQEALMASAWEQAAELAHVNQRMRQLQMSLAVGERLHARHLVRFSEEMTLRIAAPLFSRIRVAADRPNQLGPTLVATQMATSLPVSATRAAMRRIGRQRGPLTRRIAAQGAQRSMEMTWVAAFNLGGQFPSRPAPPALDQAALPILPDAAEVTAAAWHPGFQVAPEGQPLAAIPPRDLLPPAWDYPGFFRAAAVERLARIRQPAVGQFTPPIVTMEETRALVRTQTHPRRTLAALARAVISTGDNVLPPAAPGVTPIGLETVMMAPSFPQPMYEALRDLSQNLVLPGLDAVEPDTVLGLKTNRAFVDAYMVGLNFEMARELLWRGFPTDQQGTYFRNFWNRDTASPANAVSTDIDDLLTWGTRPLGAEPSGQAKDQFVLLLRSELLRRYPDALVYLTPSVNGAPGPGGAAADILPIFSGEMDPDVSFFGFPVTSAAAVGTGRAAGYFVVIQEHPTAPRFGLDVNTPVGSVSHLAIGTQAPPWLRPSAHVWGFNAAHMAGITRRRPTRIAIHASQLLSR